MIRAGLLSLLLCCVAPCGTAEQQPLAGDAQRYGSTEVINVAAASNFTAPMKALANTFEKLTGHVVRLAFGSSGKFYAQIKNGAPFMVFFSADQDKPTTLEQDDLAVPGTQFTYAVGKLALWSADPDLIDTRASILMDNRFNKLALANPRVAPYGMAAVEVLEFLQLRDRTEPKWVQGENIAQTYQFVSTGNADIGFVALSQIMQNGVLRQGSYWPVPDGAHLPIRQDVVLLRRGESSIAARALLDFIKSDQGRAIIEAYGYGQPSFELATELGHPRNEDGPRTSHRLHIRRPVHEFLP